MRGIVVEQTSLDAPLELVEGSPTSLVVVDGMEEPTLAIAECGRLHRTDQELPILFIGDEDGCLEAAALRAGATVFLTHPISTERLWAYADRHSRRTSETRVERGLLPLDDGVFFDAPGHRLVAHGSECPLTEERFRLLNYLVSNRGRAVDVDELIRNKIFTAGQRGRYRAAICELRRRLGPAARLIQTVPGFGYRFDVAERYREPS